MTLIEAISNNLRRIMKDRGVTVQKLSEESKVSKSAINNILNQRVKNIRTTTLIKLADVLKVKLDDFLEGSGSRFKR